MVVGRCCSAFHDTVLELHLLRCAHMNDTLPCGCFLPVPSFSGSLKSLEEVTGEWQGAMKECHRCLHEKLKQDLKDQGSNLTGMLNLRTCT
jgi:hypothetical protein